MTVMSFACNLNMNASHAWAGNDPDTRARISIRILSVS